MSADDKIVKMQPREKNTVEIKLPLTIPDLEKILPHRYPFLMLDRITEFVDREYIKGIKNVSINEPYFNGHFPGAPMMPAVLVIEALAQLGCVYSTISSGGKPDGSILVFTGLDKARFRRQVIPGDVLTLEAAKFSTKFGHWKMECSATVDGEPVVAAVLRAAEVSLAQQ